jgi:hypothetical protein
MYGTAYIEQPRWAKWVERGMYLTRYALTGAAGLLATLSIGSVTLDVSGWALMFFSVIAFVATSTRFMNIEAVCIWPMLAALTSIAGWGFTHNLPTVGLLVVALVPDLAVRLLRLNLIAGLQRRMEKRG